MKKRSPIVANKATRKYHSVKRGDSCRAAEILEKNRASFESESDAIKAGMTACRRCFPSEVSEREEDVVEMVYSYGNDADGR